MASDAFACRPERPRVAIDARAASHPQSGGFKTYTENLIKHLGGNEDRLDFRLYLDRPLVAGLPAALTARVIPTAMPYLGVPLREQVLVPYRSLCDRADLVHFPCGTGAVWPLRPFVITVHDTIEWMPVAAGKRERSPRRVMMHLYSRFVQRAAVRRAAAVLTVSENSKRDIVRHFGVPPARVFVTYEAAAETFGRVEDPRQLGLIRERMGLAQPFVLAIGSADPRKNLASLLEAYGLLPAELVEEYLLAIVLTHGHLAPGLQSLARRLGLSRRVRFLRGVADAELALLYNAASLFVFPSLYEGFGLPPLEAMACGTPVVAADNSSLPEVVGDAGVLVDVGGRGGPARLAAAVARVLGDEGLRRQLARRGQERARSFSWQRCAAQTIGVYEAALGRRLAVSDNLAVQGDFDAPARHSRGIH